MNELNLKVKLLHPNASAPSYAKDGDAGLDLTATTRRWDALRHMWEYGFGIAMEIPVGYAGFIFPRSSIYKKDQSLTNCVGVIDSGYRGEIKAVFRPEGYGDQAELYEVGDRIAQIIVLPIPRATVTVVKELSATARGEGGFGSSGN